MADIPQFTLFPKPCAAEGCDDPAKVRGHCRPHYFKLWKHGDPLYSRPQGPTTCKAEGCTQPHSARGWCRKHYNKYRPRPSCIIPGCSAPAIGRGWCNKHYWSWRNYGEPVREVTTEDRFWAKVNLDGPVPEYAPDLGPCWLWTGATAGTGYGHIRIAGHAVPVHRYAYELLVGPIPEGLQLDHLCRVRHCCNPGHLEPVTQRENVLRGTGVSARHARKTHCPQGHEYTPENTYRYAGRVCRQCAGDHARAANRRYKESLAR